jgi:hypothetical protein
VAGFYEHGNEPSGSLKKGDCCLTSSGTISFSKNMLHHGVSTIDIHCQSLLVDSFQSQSSKGTGP